MHPISNAQQPMKPTMTEPYTTTQINDTSPPTAPKPPAEASRETRNLCGVDIERELMISQEAEPKFSTGSARKFV